MIVILPDKILVVTEWVVSSLWGFCKPAAASLSETDDLVDSILCVFPVIPAQECGSGVRTASARGWLCAYDRHPAALVA